MRAVVVQSPDLDFAPGLPSYVTKPMLGEYIERYASEFGVAPLTTFGATVTRVAPLATAAAPAAPAAAAATEEEEGERADGDGATARAAGAPEDERWEVSWTAADGAARSDVFDAVVVANGHYDEPYVPTLPGEVAWRAADAARAIVHSRAYDDAEEFRGGLVWFGLVWFGLVWFGLVWLFSTT